MNDNNSDNYIRKDVFDARMDRMEALLEKTLLEMKADNEKLRSEMRENNARLEAKIDSTNSRLEAKIETLTQRVDQNFAFLNMRIDSVQTSVYWGFAALSILIAFITFFPAIGDFVKNLRKPSITREEVESMINSALAKQSNL